MRQGALIAAVLVGIVLTFFGGRALGYGSGERDGYRAGHSAGYSEGQADGYDTGYAEGKSDGYDAGEAAGYADGYQAGEGAGWSKGCRAVFNSLGAIKVVDYWDWYWSNSPATNLSISAC